MTHLNFKQEEEGVWSVEADPSLALKDLTEFVSMSPEEQMEYVMEKHARIHYLKAAIKIVESHARNDPSVLIAMELARLNINIMLHTLLEKAENWEDEKRIGKAIALSECWHEEVDEELHTIPLN